MSRSRAERQEAGHLAFAYSLFDSPSLNSHRNLSHRFFRRISSTGFTSWLHSRLQWRQGIPGCRNLQQQDSTQGSTATTTREQAVSVGSASRLRYLCKSSWSADLSAALHELLSAISALRCALSSLLPPVRLVLALHSSRQQKRMAVLDKKLMRAKPDSASLEWSGRAILAARRASPRTDCAGGQRLM
ncbi:hypothetical protein AAT19DRAFT_10032 [Rhodotorula toruloides]|uniref:Uncharacterized protein n=1 Tax=Rhodotorula toruloides TaxID=5286 RepID=A0A2T0A1M8_RHOTO|nr:hypothetical protein AAT19DRAFT_10032 [Rhodotorula toruloides]